MAHRFQTRITIAVAFLVVLTIAITAFVLMWFTVHATAKMQRDRGHLLTALAQRNLEYGAQLPGKVMDRVGEQMAVTALLASELVAVAEQDASLSPEQISAILARVIERSENVRGYPLVDEFWVTDETGHAYIHTEDFDFTFSPDSKKTPQASEFWPLLEQGAPPVLQELQARTEDGKRFKYVGASGVDKPRIVQVGVGEGLVTSIKSDFLIQNTVEHFAETMRIDRIAVIDWNGDVLAAASAEHNASAPIVARDAIEFCTSFLRSIPERGVQFRRNPEEHVDFRVSEDGHAGVVTSLVDPEGGNPKALLVEFEAERLFSFLRDRLMYTAIVAVIMSVVGILMSIKLSRGLSKPIRQLAEVASEFGSGNFEHRIHLKTHDETRLLGDAFNQMADSVQDYMRDLQRETSQRERLESELRIAAELQRSLLPEQPPRVDGLELAGWSRPAREVGGDFYDFVDMGPGRLGVVIGDATDKGLSAALLTTECWSVLKALAGEGFSPSELLFRTNNALCKRLDGSGRFVTAFFMVIDVPQGILRYSVAGHNPPILVRSEATRRKLLASREGLPLGLVKDCEFADIEVSLAPFDTILLYSDGLTEAPDPDKVRYGDDRLEAMMDSVAERPVPDLVAAILQDVERHTGRTEREDDMTIVGVRFRP